MVDGMQTPALQVIVLGSGGGPVESNTTAFLVRSIATNWQKGSLLAVDAGVHLGAIVKILDAHNKSEQSENDPQAPSTLIDGPFGGLRIPHKSSVANAAHITKSLVDTFVITHPHLDHISGFVVNTASLKGTRPKRLAGLPYTINAFREHIFNNIIWPNLSDENNGVGLVTYMRLVEGGSVAIGEGESKGYVEVCEGLSVKTWGVSHGHCMESHPHRSPAVPSPGHQTQYRGRGSVPPSFHMHLELPQEGASSMSMQRQRSASSGYLGGDCQRDGYFSTPEPRACISESCAYFIRDQDTGKEVLIFGDLEPDSISLWARNRQVWMDAAPKIASGLLKGIFIECSYDDSRSENMLFGHLAPRYLIAELGVLATEIQSLKEEKEKENKKRKRYSHGSSSRPENPRRRSNRAPHGPGSPLNVASPLSRLELYGNIDGTRGESASEPIEEATADIELPNQALSHSPRMNKPLEGVKVVIIHVKEGIEDGPSVSETILRELREHDEAYGLGCEFILAHAGQSVYL